MTTDVFGAQVINDGQAIDSGDLNALSSRTLAYVYDQILASILPREAFTTSTDVFFDAVGIEYALTLTVRGGHPEQGSANNKVQISSGTLLQQIATIDGSGPQLLAFTFDGGDEVTIANGDATNPRVDIIQMKLDYVVDTPVTRDFQDAATRAPSSQTFNSRRRVRCTLSVKQGTPAASPQYPTPDAGYCVIAGVVVGATYSGASPLAFDDTAGAVAVLHDQRMPLRVSGHGVMANDMIYSGTDFVPTGGFYLERINNVDGNSLYITPHRWGNSGRLVGYDCQMRDFTTLTSKVIRFDPGGASGTVLGNANLTGSGSGSMSLRRVSMAQFQALHAPAAGPTVLATANGMGPPVWANGRRAPGMQNTGENDTSFPIEVGQVALQFVTPAASNRWARATFYLAEGL